MALSATPYKVDVNLTDLDRNVYETLRFTVARHPSETEERLCARLIAYILWYSESLAFGRGLSNVDEPALWEKKPGWPSAALDRGRFARRRALNLVFAPR